MLKEPEVLKSLFGLLKDWICKMSVIVYEMLIIVLMFYLLNKSYDDKVILNENIIKIFMSVDSKIFEIINSNLKIQKIY